MATPEEQARVKRKIDAVLEVMRLAVAPSLLEVSSRDLVGSFEAKPTIEHRRKLVTVKTILSHTDPPARVELEQQVLVSAESGAGVLPDYPTPEDVIGLSVDEVGAMVPPVSLPRSKRALVERGAGAGDGKEELNAAIERGVDGLLMQALQWAARSVRVYNERGEHVLLGASVR